MHRTFAHFAGLSLGLELLGDGGKELRPQALTNRLGQRQQQVFLLGEMQR